MRLILTADDFGLDQDTVAATTECFEMGALTSASIMARMPATAAAVEYARRRPDLSFGVHLTYVRDTVEAPLSDPETIPALVGPDGNFLPSNTVRMRALNRRIPIEQIVRETEAQLAFVRDQNIAVSHVDSHGHLHKFGIFREALCQVLPRFGIHKVRSVQDIYLRRLWKSPTYWFGVVWRHSIRKQFVTTDHLYLCGATMDSDWPARLLAKHLDGSLEIGVHPGHKEDWRRHECASIKELVILAREYNHKLIGWAHL